MAQPIPLTLPPRNPQRELEVRLQALPAKHAEAILAAYEVLQLMHDKGVLELMRGTLGGGEVVVQQAVAVAKDPASIRVSRNALLLIKALGEVEPDLLNDFTKAVPTALAQANREEAKPPGLFKLLRTFFDADFRRGLAAFNDLLQVFGRNLTNKVRENGDT
jgi:uncharacterized protein YjgD (DUF1641 family)